MKRHKGISFFTKSPDVFFNWKKKKSVLLMVPLSGMNPSCVILITGETWKTKLLVASNALYESQ